MTSQVGFRSRRRFRNRQYIFPSVYFTVERIGNRVLDFQIYIYIIFEKINNIYYIIYGLSSLYCVYALYLINGGGAGVVVFPQCSLHRRFRSDRKKGQVRLR